MYGAGDKVTKEAEGSTHLTVVHAEQKKEKEKKKKTPSQFPSPPALEKSENLTGT